MMECRAAPSFPRRAAALRAVGSRGALRRLVDERPYIVRQLPQRVQGGVDLVTAW